MNAVAANQTLGSSRQREKRNTIASVQEPKTAYRSILAPQKNASYKIHDMIEDWFSPRGGDPKNAQDIDEIIFAASTTINAGAGMPAIGNRA